MAIRDNLKHCTYSQLMRIKENQYRSADNCFDYCPFEVEDRLTTISRKQAESMSQVQTLNSVFDSNLSALMSVSMPKKWLLSMIDYAFKRKQPVKSAFCIFCMAFIIFNFIVAQLYNFGYTSFYRTHRQRGFYAIHLQRNC